MMTATAITFCGCPIQRAPKLEINRALTPSPKTSSKTNSKPRSSENSITDCCWCYLKDIDENDLRTYRGVSSCEERSGQGGYRNCKHVKVIGEDCLMVENVGEPNCQFHDVKYVENGIQKTISPPNRPCNVSVLGVGAKEGPAKTIEEIFGDRNAAFIKQDCSWSCEQDPVDSASCRATLLEGNSVVKQSSTRRTGDQKDCSDAVCDALFSSQFSPLCSSFSAKDE